MLRAALKDFKAPAAPIDFPKVAVKGGPDKADTGPARAEVCPVDEKAWPSPPAGGLVMHVNGMNLDRQPAMGAHSGLGRSTLWVRKDEADALAKGEFPRSLAMRIGRFSVVDNTTGKSPSWKPEAVKQADLRIENGRVTGPVVIEMVRPDNHKCWFRGHALGFVEAKDGKVTRLDMVIRGEAHGLAYAYNATPPVFPLLLTFRLGDPADQRCLVPPPGYLNDRETYLRRRSPTAGRRFVRG